MFALVSSFQIQEKKDVHIHRNLSGKQRRKPFAIKGDCDHNHVVCSATAGAGGLAIGPSGHCQEKEEVGLAVLSGCGCKQIAIP